MNRLKSIHAIPCNASEKGDHANAKNAQDKTLS
jgi:hypothetical protein